MTNLETDQRTERFPTSPPPGSWLPDAPGAAVGMWILLIGLIGSDVAMLKPMVAAATDESTSWLTWLLTIGIGVALAAIMYLAAEFWMRGRRGGAGVSLTIWLATVALSFFFRLRFHSPADSGLSSDSITMAADTSPRPQQNSFSQEELLVAGLLTALLVLTGVIAAGMTALTHDPLQKQRRARARQHARLRVRLDRAIYAENRHRTAANARQSELDDLDKRTAEQREKLPGIAESICQEIRLRISTALGDPASTTALTQQRPSLVDRRRG